MALSIVQVVGGIASPAPYAQSISTTAGNLIVVAVNGSSTSIPTVSDSASQTYTLGPNVVGSAGRSGGIYYFANSAALSSITISGAGNCAYTIYEISGAATSSPLDASGTHSLTYSNFTLSASGANASANDIVIAAVFHYYGAPTTTSSGYTTETDQLTAGSVGIRTFDKIVSATETSSIAITATGYGDTSAIATFKQGGGGGSVITKTQSSIARIATKPSKTQTATSRVANTITKTQPTIGSITTENYTYASVTSVPTDASDLTNKFLAADDISVGTDDGNYFTLAGANTYNVIQFKYQNPNGNSTDQIALTLKGKSAKATSTTTAYLQIYNYSSLAWETLASNSSTAANTVFTLSATQSASPAHYYTAGNWVAVRMYQ